MTELVFAAALFVVAHFALSATPVRTRLINVLGEWVFLGLYSVIALGAMGWMVHAYAEAPIVDVWFPHMAFRHVPIGIMPLVCVMLISGYTSANPTAMGFKAFRGLEQGPHGIFRITRHPILWGIGLWAFAHFLASGAAAEMVLFGALALLAIGGTVHIDYRKTIELGDDWVTYRAATSSIPFLAIIQKRQHLGLKEIGLWRIVMGLALFGGIFVVHETMTGLSPLPLP